MRQNPQCGIATTGCLERGIVRLLEQDLTPMERFEKFMLYAADLYGDYEGATDKFMRDVTEVLHGVRYDPSGPSFLDQSFAYLQGEGNNTPYFLGVNSFNDQEDLVKNEQGLMPNSDEGWNEKYRDKCGNQAYHFWFYAALAYFDGANKAAIGNLRHDGASVSPLPFLEEGPGVTEKDYRLGQVGVQKGHELSLYNETYGTFAGTIGTSPSELAQSLRADLGK
jgi:hypothetical protein